MVEGCRFQVTVMLNTKNLKHKHWISWDIFLHIHSLEKTRDKHVETQASCVWWSKKIVTTANLIKNFNDWIQMEDSERQKYF